jgi:alpha-glucosidase
MLLLNCLRGNIFLYYGEELGLTQVPIAKEDLRDPEAIANWPLTLSRDGARTPMPWNSEAPQLGFSAAKPWLPVGPDHAALAVDVQERDEESLLQLTRRLLALRSRETALRTGSLKIIEASETTLVFVRTDGAKALTCAFNFSKTTASWAGKGRLVEAVNGGAIDTLPPFSGVVLRSD